MKLKLPMWHKINVIIDKTKLLYYIPYLNLLSFPDMTSMAYEIRSIYTVSFEKIAVSHNRLDSKLTNCGIQLPCASPRYSPKLE